MKYFSITLFFFSFMGCVRAQNVGVSMTAAHSGNAKIGQTILVEIWINNTSSNLGPVLPWRLKPQINIPESLQLAETGHQLPEGWKIFSQAGRDIRLTNGTDIIPPNEQRIVKLAFLAIKVSSGENVMTNVLFSNGNDPGNMPGPSLKGDLPGDNAAYTIIKVTR